MLGQQQEKNTLLHGQVQCCGAEIIYFRLRLLFGFSAPFVHNFGSGYSSSACHTLPLKTVPYYNSSTIRNKSQRRFFFILASSKLTTVNIYKKDNFGSGSQIISAQQAPQHCFEDCRIPHPSPGTNGFFLLK